MHANEMRERIVAIEIYSLGFLHQIKELIDAAIGIFLVTCLPVLI